MCSEQKITSNEQKITSDKKKKDDEIQVLSFMLCHLYKKTQRNPSSVFYIIIIIIV